MSYLKIILLSTVLGIIVVCPIASLALEYNDPQSNASSVTSTSEPNSTPEMNYSKASVGNSNGYCVEFYGSELQPTTVTVINCGKQPATLRIDKVYEPTLESGETRMLDFPVGYQEFAATIYRLDGQFVGKVDLDG